jgi:indole-3-acetate monooxygenase
MAMEAVTDKAACSSPGERESDAGATMLNAAERMAALPPEQATSGGRSRGANGAGADEGRKAPMARADLSGAAGIDHLAAARRLEPLVAELRVRFDSERQLPRRLVDQLHEAGVFRMWLPHSLGGAELAPLPFMEVIEELSRQDGSVGWCAVIPAGSARFAGSLDESAARAVFGTGRGVLVGMLNPVGKATPVRGGYRVTGRWGYGSFIHHADWVLGGCVTDDGETRLCLFPREDAEVFDVWHVCGLRATGSNDYQVTDLFVPERHTIPLVDFQPPPRVAGPLYAVPLTSAFASCIAVVALGIARAAIEALVAIGADKRIAGSSAALRDTPAAQADLAQAEALLGSARAYLFGEVGRMWEDTVAGRTVAVRDRAAVRLAASHATQCAIEAVDLAYRLAGGAALHYDSRLERCFRDVHVVGQHAMLSRHTTLELAGRVLFGLPPGTARL